MVFHNEKIKKNVIHISQFTFPQKEVDKYDLFVMRIDVCFDVFYDFC